MFVKIHEIVHTTSKYRNHIIKFQNNNSIYELNTTHRIYVHLCFIQQNAVIALRRKNKIQPQTK